MRSPLALDDIAALAAFGAGRGGDAEDLRDLAGEEDAREQDAGQDADREIVGNHDEHHDRGHHRRGAFGVNLLFGSLARCPGDWRPA
jgi:hypothetical protein